tara:strand:- start:701 stop:2506 length:1806 start_codon:yes stop_codon:yes gene_type:complete
MASTYVNDLRLEKIGDGEQSTTWGDTTNTNLELIAEAFSYGTEAITTNADAHSTTIADGATDPGRSLYLKYTGTLDSTCTVSLLPNTVSKVWIIENATSGGYDLSIKQGSGAEIAIPNGDVKIVYSDGAGSGAAIYDALVDLNIATKLTVKNPATSASPATLLLQSGDTDVAADDVLGKIQFQAPDEGTGTDAILVAAEVAAVSEGDFSSSSNATKLSFKTGASEAATEKMSISSVGNVTMKQTATGDDTPMTLLLQTGETDIAADDVLGKIQFQAPDEGTGTDAILVAAEIAAFSEGDFSSSSNATSLSFKTGASEAATQKMVINSAGEVGIGVAASTTATLKVYNNETSHNVGYFHQDNASSSDVALYSLHDGSGTGVYGYAGGIGVRGHSTGNAGVYGTSAAANYGGYFTSTGNYGAYAKTTSSGSYGGLLAYDDGSTYCILGYSPSSTAYSFYGNGNGYISGTFTSSDSRLKDIQSRITTSDGMLAKINQLKPTYYKWKSNSDQGQKDNSEQIGLIAQEVESVFSHIVKEAPVPDLSESPPDADGKVEKRDKTLNEELGDTKFITYEKLTVYLTAALQEASAKIDALETRIAALESS